MLYYQNIVLVICLVLHIRLTSVIVFGSINNNITSAERDFYYKDLAFDSEYWAEKEREYLRCFTGCRKEVATSTVKAPIQLRMLNKIYLREMGEVKRFGWPKVMRHLVRVGSVVSDRFAPVGLLDMVDWWFLDQKHNEAFAGPWVGFLHYAANFPPDYYQKSSKSRTLSDLFEVPAFLDSLPHCKALITFCSSSQKWLALRPEVRTRDIPVYFFKLPISYEQPTSPLTTYNFTIGDVSKKSLLFLGQQYRRVETIDRLEVPYPKQWLVELGLDGKNHVDPRKVRAKVANWRVNITSVKSNVRYRELLMENIVLIDTWTTFAVPELLDCIYFNVPVIVRKMSATVDYLGPDYPLFFQTHGALIHLMNNKALLEIGMRKAKAYLTRMDKRDLTYDFFNTRLVHALTHITTPAKELPPLTNTPGVLVVVPLHLDSTRSSTLKSSLEQLKKSFTSAEVRFRCVVYVSKKFSSTSRWGLSTSFGPCALVVGAPHWTSNVQEMDLAAVQETHVMVLSEEVQLATEERWAEMLSSLQKFNFDVASAGFSAAPDFPSLQVRRGCEAHRTDFVDMHLTLFSLDAFRCWQSHFDPKVNLLGFGYDVTFSTLCSVRLGVLDLWEVRWADKHIRHVLSVEEAEQRERWLTKSMGLNSTEQAGPFLREITLVRPSEFAFCQQQPQEKIDMPWLKQKISCHGKFELPTLEHPLFFFHVPRTGGSTLREVLNRGARRSKLIYLNPGMANSFAPARWQDADVTEKQLDKCPYGQDEQPLACSQQLLTACASVFAVNAGNALPLAIAAAGDGAHKKCKRGWSPPAHPSDVPFDSFSCIMMMRDPAERVLSCYIKQKKEVYGMFASLSREQKLRVIQECGGSATLRYFGGGPAYVRGPGDMELQRDGGNLTLALQTVQHCFVMMQHDWAGSLSVMWKNFPWLQRTIAFTRTKELENVTVASPEDRAFISAALPAEETIFKYALVKFHEQMVCYRANTTTPEK